MSFVPGRKKSNQGMPETYQKGLRNKHQFVTELSISDEIFLLETQLRKLWLVDRRASYLVLLPSRSKMWALNAVALDYLKQFPSSSLSVSYTLTFLRHGKLR